MSKYEDYLNSPEWAIIRRLALEYAGHSCQLCGSKDRLQVHHRTYDRCYGKERLADLTVLCVRCHEFFSEKSGQKKRRRKAAAIPAKTVRHILFSRDPEVAHIDQLMMDNVRKMKELAGDHDRIQPLMARHQELLDKRKRLLAIQQRGAA